MEQHATSYGARWIIPISCPPFENGAIVVANGRIREIVPGGRVSATVDLGEVALLPGLINAHTHLEFSGLNRPLGEPGIAITDWIPQVIAERQKVSGCSQEDKYGQIVQSSIMRGIRESVASGIAAIGEIATSPWYCDVALDDPVHIVGFIERLGHDPSRTSLLVSEAERWLDEVNRLPSSQEWFTPGLSPHAPYSMHDDLFRQLVDLSIKRRLPVAMHLAESEQEIRWLSDGGGPFADMLDAFGIAFQRPHNKRPLDYLLALSKTVSSLVIHGNYLTNDELDFMSKHADHMHLVFCPRTHEYFAHKPWPMQAALERGINIAIGTDSRASNPDLDLRQELRALLRMYPDVSPTRVLFMGTLGGARALGLGRHLGSLEPGKRAIWKSFEIPKCKQNEIERIVLENCLQDGTM